jgi:hypothetical protein
VTAWATVALNASIAMKSIFRMVASEDAIRIATRRVSA